MRVYKRSSSKYLNAQQTNKETLKVFREVLPVIHGKTDERRTEKYGTDESLFGIGKSMATGN